MSVKMIPYAIKQTLSIERRPAWSMHGNNFLFRW